mgnify:CR=1 FL=1|tara:strand:+ start:2993 stop:3724 length:732 start_codon:yes stop_codon:yes gene_type:complete
MIKFFFRYSISLFAFILFGILLLDYILLPSYVGYNNEKYLPDLRNEFKEKAIYKLTELGFNANIILVSYSKEYQPGTVIKMFPRPFTKVKVGSNIDLTVAGKDQDVIIPDIRFMTLRNAKINIAKLGLAIDTIIYEYDNSIKQGDITFHFPKYNQIVKSSSKLTLGVSKGPPPDYYIVPNVINLSLNRAKFNIENIGLRLGNINYEYQPDFLPNTVIEQNMTPGMRVSFPATINLIISKTEKD